MKFYYKLSNIFLSLEKQPTLHRFFFLRVMHLIVYPQLYAKKPFNIHCFVEILCTSIIADLLAGKLSNILLFIRKPFSVLLSFYVTLCKRFLLRQYILFWVAVNCRHRFFPSVYWINATAVGLYFSMWYVLGIFKKIWDE